MDELFELYHRYKDGIYSISDVERIVSYMPVPNVDDKYLKDVENQIEMIRFLTEESEQKQKVLSVLYELIKKAICRNDINCE